MNSQKKSLLLATIIAVITIGFSSVGCGPKGVSDQSLATDIKAKLFADQNARTANVNVDVSNGVVKLTGTAPSADVALQVVNIANGTAGVKSVDNELKVTAPPAAADNSAAPPMTSPAPAPPETASTPPVAPPQAIPPPVAQAAPPPPPPLPAEPTRRVHHEPVPVTVPQGTDIQVRMIDSIDSKTNTAGQTFRASLAAPVVVDGRTVFPRGSDATVLLDNAKAAGRIAGKAELSVRVIKIMHAGQSYDVDTDVHAEEGKSRGKQTAIRSGIGAAAGAVIGAIAGGGKGAAIGTLAGGGAGAGFQLATHGQQVSIPSETLLTFRTLTPVTITLPPR